jgi:hypothetical protein
MRNIVSLLNFDYTVSRCTPLTLTIPCSNIYLECIVRIVNEIFKARLQRPSGGSYET